ncbi:unnamed protein product [Linum tenue]|uniref:Uncharacterized protein n=1 Tax=Linum tenue TaxID=586396 RepID=A0AAV0JDX2_9ROSI|nr:unnamed protein product [Linum tenue]CAI0407546.1 unnamed protein product [Linum tenue]
MSRHEYEVEKANHLLSGTDPLSWWLDQV